MPRFKTQQITIAMPAGPLTVEASVTPCGCLAIHRTVEPDGIVRPSARWTVTATGSGLATAAFPSRAAAREFAIVFAQAICELEVATMFRTETTSVDVRIGCGDRVWRALSRFRSCWLRGDKMGARLHIVAETT